VLNQNNEEVMQMEGYSMFLRRDVAQAKDPDHSIAPN
jgi:hypothetical protein